MYISTIKMFCGISIALYPSVDFLQIFVKLRKRIHVLTALTFLQD